MEPLSNGLVVRARQLAVRVLGSKGSRRQVRACPAAAPAEVANGARGAALDVLDAQRSYFDAQVELSNAISEEYLALIELYKTLGGGW